MTVFEIAKEKLPMRDVLESYGISVNRSGMCLCPFHSEKTPSCKVYPDSLHCFGCGEHHDIISFAKTYFNLNTQFDALKKLNDDFNLGLSLNATQKPNKSEISEYVKRKTEKEQYADWEKSAWKTLRDRFRLMREFKGGLGSESALSVENAEAYKLQIHPHSESKKYAPKNPYDIPDARFVAACHYLEYSEYILEEYMDTPFDERRQFENEVESAREFISEWTNYHPEMKKYCKKQEEVSIDSLMKRRSV